MSETETDPNQGADAACAETAPVAPEQTDNYNPAVTTLTEPTPPENAVSGATELHWESHSQAQSYSAAVSGSKLDDIARQCGGGGITMSQIGLRKHLPASTEALNQWAKEYGETARKTEAEGAVTLDDVMRACNTADSIARATGTEAAVCADIAERQRSKGLPKYKITVAENPLPLVEWLQHAYEEVLDLAIYLKRTIHEIETTNDPTGSRRMAGSVTGKLRRTRAPGSGRKPIPCPNCGAEKSIGMTTLNKIPTRRCKACGFVVKQYPNLAKAATA